MELTDVNSFVKPWPYNVTLLAGGSDYVVSLEKKPNRYFQVQDGRVKRLLDFMFEYNLQQGYPYYVVRGVPRKMLNVIQILREARVISGIEIDDNGFVTYVKEDENE
ncbi:30S ribosomal protein S8 [Kosakonia phage Kc263]|uniref:30S ribosomal protein S8 n=1 Tax=Kosakonia phage Kc263 TaxID=2863194 RepID=A0AAE8BEH4_9CAUD|nr:30S ribosomal protein S8 [Kosakonia phage Kc263]QYN80045.1 30S ribosomal protein S8 [Kosakonia phage Kc263]